MDSAGNKMRWIERTITIAGFTIVLVVTLLGWNKTSNESAAETALLQHRVTTLEAEVDAHDFDVIEYKLDQVILALEDLKTKLE